MNYRLPHGEEWPSAKGPDQREDQKVGRVVTKRFRAMKFGAQSPESVQLVRCTLFLGADA